MEENKIDKRKRRGPVADIRKSIPPGWKILNDATNAPQGYEWMSNGKSRFDNDYKKALIPKKIECQRCHRMFRPEEILATACPECNKWYWDHMSDESAAAIAGAVIQQAEADYIKDVKAWRSAWNPQQKLNAYYKIRYWLNWWRTEFPRWSLDTVDPSYLIRLMNKEVYKKSKKKQIHKYKVK